MGTETSDDFFTGQAAALAGGTTMHIDFIIPPEGDLAAGLKAWQEKAKKSCMDYGFHMAVTTWNAKVAKDMEILVQNSGKASSLSLMTEHELLIVLSVSFQITILAQEGFDPERSHTQCTWVSGACRNGVI